MIPSVKDRYEVGDLVGFSPDLEFITEFGTVHKFSRGKMVIHWEAFGEHSAEFPKELPAGHNWPNFGPDTPKNRLIAKLKYFKG